MLIRDREKLAGRLTEHGPMAPVATLGPSGTTSERAAWTFVAIVAEQLGTSALVRLEDSFEQAVTRVLEGRDAAVLVPSAYGGIAPFYMHPAMELAAVFIQRTPEYGAAARADNPIPFRVRVAAHPATYSLVEYLLPASCRPSDVISTPATSRAAELVARGGADVAITNRGSAQRHGLQLCPGRTFAFDMVWSAFIARDDARGRGPEVG